MEKIENAIVDPFDRLHECLQKLIGLNRQLLEIIRVEHEALVQAQLKSIQEATYAKHALIEVIREKDSERRAILAEVSTLWKKPIESLTLGTLIHGLQNSTLQSNQKRAELFQSNWNTLTVLLKRVLVQNEENRILVEKFLMHLNQMKLNVLGEFSPKADLYTQQGTRASASTAARLISKEV